MKSLDEPLISVIIPTYNRAHLVGRAIKSVLEQSFSAFELLIIDDYSIDETAQIVAQWDDARIRYLRLDTNRGSSAARNAGIRAAKAEFITFLDDDDEFLPNALAELYQAISHASDTVAYVIGGIVRVIDGPQGEVPNGIYQPQIPVESRGESYLRFLRRLPFGTGFGALFRRSVFNTAGLFDEQLWASVDRDIFLRLLLHFDFIVIDKPLVKIHKHNAPQLTDPTVKRVMANELILKKHLHALQSRPQLYSYLLYSLAIDYYRHNAREEARRHFWHATRLYPFYAKAWVSFLCYELFHFSPSTIRSLWSRRPLSQSLLTKYR